MSADIYYFSSSGNSLAAARYIAEKLKGKLIGIPSVINQASIKTKADVIGIVFPVYFAEYRGVPLIVWRFIEKFEDLGSKYLFALATHSGGPASTMEHLAEHLAKHGGRLAGGFTEFADVGYPVSLKLKKALFGKGIDKLNIEAKLSHERKKVYENVKCKLDAVSDYVSLRKEGTLETHSPLVKFLVSLSLPLRRLIFMARYEKLAEESRRNFYELVPLADRSFQINSTCNSCGICVRICPVNNIEMVEGKPCFKHHCENCFACFKWCPEEAIAGKIVEYGTRFHHPEVKVKDFLNQSSGG